MLTYSSLILLVLANQADGSPTGRIVGGEEAAAHSWPWQLSLQNKGSHVCGASILSANYAVTAAHCVESFSVADLTIVAGLHSRLNPETTSQTRPLASYTMHPSYDGNAGGFPNDIAVLHFESPLELNAQVAPANLVQDDTNDFSGATDCFITGWGRLSGGGTIPDLLQEAPTNVMSNSQCSLSLGLPGLFLRSSHICVYNSQTGACNGDSGGPLVCMHQGVYTLVGATSWGLSNCPVTSPSVYTRVSKFLGWIRDNTDLS